MVLLERMLDTAEHYGMFRTGDRIGVAVSGGADSVALLHALVELAPRWSLRLRVLHVNHLLRGADSDADQCFVEETARQLGLTFECTKVDVGGIASETGDNLEQAGRLARRRCFLKLMADGILDRVATGHTRSDQAETVLYRLLRGAGTAGLSAIRPVTQEGVVRPLIAVTRDETREFLRTKGIAWREDVSNQDLRLDRNRIRAELLPLLALDWNPTIETALARTARIAAADEAYWEKEIGRLAEELIVERPPAVLVSCNRLRQLPTAVLWRLLRAALKRVRGDLLRIDSLHVERIEELTRSRPGTGRASLPGVEVVRSCDWIRLARPANPADTLNYRVELPVPGEVKIPALGESLRCELVNRSENDGYNEKVGSDLDWGRISGSLEVRNWRPGDRFQPAGRPARKMKVWFQRERVPLWDRPGWPMVTCSGNIVWTRKLGAAEGFAARADSARIVRVSEHGIGDGT